MVARTKLKFTRFEFKYVLPQHLREEVEAELGHFVELDPFVQGRPAHKYFVRSLYWDDHRLTAFHDKIDGLMLRRKFRIRTYTRDAEADVPRFLEIKGRHNNLVLKSRAPLDLGPEHSDAAGDTLADLVMERTTRGKIHEEFCFQRFRRAIRPNVLIDYERRPYVSRFDPEFRLTFDEGLRATHTDRLFPRPIDRSVPVVPGFTVMELKFRYHVPSWFHRIIQGYQLRRRSFSKVVEGTVALGLADDEG